ncbi:MAG: PadR family transcriptional regulator [Candidatus Dormibacteria bacterium]
MRDHEGGNGWTNAREAFRSRSLLQPCLLLLLEDSSGYGYELHQQIGALLRERWDNGTIYRALNALENDDLVTSHWEPSATGPPRRRYSILPAGLVQLADWVRGVAQLNTLLLDILIHYECGRQRSPAARPGGPRTDEDAFWVRRVLKKFELSTECCMNLGDSPSVGRDWPDERCIHRHPSAG